MGKRPLLVAMLLAGIVLALPARADGDHWHRPVTSVGPSTSAADLEPAACAACHPAQAADWRGSLHAAAASDGLLGQIGAFDPDTQRSCLSCHLPRAEQQAVWATAGLGARDGLHGVDCASCHVRAGQWHGPRDRAPTKDAHGVQGTALFVSADMCRACHQQAPTGAEPPLVNTWAEWRASPQAAAGQTCQDCHMPDGRHLFRGIHDPAMTRAALTLEAVRDGDGVRAVVTNSGAGHFLPTYPTPRLTLRLEAADGRSAATILQRRLEPGPDGRPRVVSDTRLPPLGSATVQLSVPPDMPASVELVVEPDADYHDRAFPALIAVLGEHLEPDARAALDAAWQRSGTSRYIAHRLDCPPSRDTPRTCVPNPETAQ